MVERKAFLMKPKRQCHLSQWGKCVYGAQSWKETRLLWEHKFISIDEQTLIIRKIMEGKPLLMRPKHQFIYPNKKNAFIVPNHEKKRYY